MKPNRVALIIDDEKQIRRLLRLAMEGADHQVYESETGKAGLAEIVYRRPDIVLLDLNLPDTTGIDILKRVKENRYLKTTPVVVLTTSEEQQDKVNSFDLGVAGYMAKPVDYRKFVEVMRSIDAYWTISEML